MDNHWILPANLTEADITAAKGFLYRITHIVSGRIYLGRKYTQARIRGKLIESPWRRYWGSSRLLAADIKQFGHTAFVREILTTYDTRQATDFAEVELLFAERVLHAKLPDGSPKFYNRNIASKWFAPLDRFSQEHKDKIASKLIGRKHQKESIERMRESKTGISHSDETKAKISASKRGQRNSAESVATGAAKRVGWAAHLKPEQRYPLKKGRETLQSGDRFHLSLTVQQRCDDDLRTLQRLARWARENGG